MRTPNLAGAYAAPMPAALSAVGPFYLGGGLGLCPSGVGLAMTAGPLAAAAAGFPGARMVDRLEGNRVMLAALAGVTACPGVSALAIALGSTFTSERVKLAPRAVRRLPVASRSAET